MIKNDHCLIDISERFGEPNEKPFRVLGANRRAFPSHVLEAITNGTYQNPLESTNYRLLVDNPNAEEPFILAVYMPLVTGAFVANLGDLSNLPLEETELTCSRYVMAHFYPILSSNNKENLYENLGNLLKSKINFIFPRLVIKNIDSTRRYGFIFPNDSKNNLLKKIQEFVFKDRSQSE